jgi:type I restriction enzyme S subunit
MNPDSESRFPQIRIADVASVVRGSSPRPAGDPRFFNGEFLPWITVADLTGSEEPTLTSTLSKLTEEGAERTRIFEPGTVLLTNSGATLGVPKICGIRAGANDGIAGFLNLSAELDSQFLYYCLSSLTEYFRTKVASGVGQPNLNTELIGDVHVPKPPLNVQHAVVRVLATWDRGIRQLTDLIAAKVRFKQGLMQQLLTGQRRFPGFKEEWRHVRIGDVAREISERNPDGDSIPVLSCTKYDGLVDSLEYFGKRVFSENTDNYKVVRRNDFAYATNHIEEGSIGLLKHADAGLVSPMYTVFRTNGDVNPDYLYRVLKTETLRQVFASFTSASVNRRGSLRWKQFSTIPLELPSVDEQCHINKAMSAFDREVKLIRSELEAIKQQKKGLMQKLLTGQVQVSLEKHMTQEFGSATS